MKRTQIQIAIDALKKQRENYTDKRNKAIVAEQEAKKSVEFFNNEMSRLDKQIASLEGVAVKETV